MVPILNTSVRLAVLSAAFILSACSPETATNSKYHTNTPAMLRQLDQQLLSVDVQIDDDETVYSGQQDENGTWRIINVNMSRDSTHSFVAKWYAKVDTGKLLLAEQSGSFFVDSMNNVAPIDDDAYEVITADEERFDFDCDGISNFTELDSDSDPLSPNLCNAVSPEDTTNRRCLVDLAAQPYGPSFIVGMAPGNCAGLVIQNQYSDYTGDDLVPWNEGVAQCWQGGAERLWIGFDLPNGDSGWLQLRKDSEVSHSDIFREDELGAADPILLTSPEPGSELVGRYTYDELAGNASQVQLDLPESFESTDEVRYHLGGCWQEADREGARGLNFFWPKGLEP